MEWYQGSISDAINEAKTSDKLLSILIYGDDSQSEQLSSSLSSELMAPLAHKLVSLKLEKPSDDLTQFSQIYPVLFVPSLYLIESRNGVALEVLVGVQQAEDLAEKITKVMESRSSLPVGESRETAPAVRAVRAEVQSPAAITTQSSGTTVESENDDQPQEQAAGSSETSEAMTAERALQEKVERAEKLIELVRQDKEKKAREEERNKEIERRDALKNIQRLKREMEEKEMMQHALQQKKEKEEDRKFKEKLQERIRQDRLERQEKYSAEKAEADEKRRKIFQEKQEEAERIKAQNSTSANIMYRMPDGSSVTHLFDATAPFIEVRQYIADLKHLTEFNLALNFPRKVLDAECNSRSLRDLQLAPNAVVLVIPKPVTGSGDASGSLKGWWEMLTAPFNIILSFLASFAAAVFPSQLALSTNTSVGQSENRGAPGPSRPRRPDTKKKTPYQRSGNIHRLNTSDESDNENNTWNGNSTQQM